MRNVIAYANARAVLVELRIDGSFARLVVSDDGLGFRPEVRAQRLAEGHLGLSLVEELVEQSGGRIEITSSEGTGTRVELEVRCE